MTVQIPDDAAHRLAADAADLLNRPEEDTPRSVILGYLADVIAVLPKTGALTYVERAERLVRLADHSDPTAAVNELTAGFLGIARAADEQAAANAMTINTANQAVAEYRDRLADARRAAREAEAARARYAGIITVIDAPPRANLVAVDEQCIVRSSDGRIFPAVRRDIDDGYPWEDLQHEWYDDEQITVLATVRDGSTDNDEYDDDWED